MTTGLDTSFLVSKYIPFMVAFLFPLLSSSSSSSSFTTDDTWTNSKWPTRR